MVAGGATMAPLAGACVRPDGGRGIMEPLGPVLKRSEERRVVGGASWSLSRAGEPARSSLPLPASRRWHNDGEVPISTSAHPFSFFSLAGPI